jgi:hypothetical protein
MVNLRHAALFREAARGRRTLLKHRQRTFGQSANGRINRTRWSVGDTCPQTDRPPPSLSSARKLGMSEVVSRAGNPIGGSTSGSDLLRVTGQVGHERRMALLQPLLRELRIAPAFPSVESPGNGWAP